MLVHICGYIDKQQVYSSTHFDTRFPGMEDTYEITLPLDIPELTHYKIIMKRSIRDKDAGGVPAVRS